VPPKLSVKLYRLSADTDTTMTPEIRAFEFALGLFTVMIGLAITDLALSLHRLIRHHETVRWDPLPLLAALFALLMTIGMWFDLWGIRNATSVRHFFLYLVLLASFFVLFLISASSLPDEVVGPVNLRAFYDSNRRYYWSLVTIFQVIYVALGVHFLAGMFARMPREELAMTAIQWSALILIPVGLFFVRSRALHYAGLIILLAIDVWHYSIYAIL
jgi:heme A synthase